MCIRDRSGLLRLKFETLDTSRGEFEGYGAVFGNVDSHGDIIEPGAFAASITHHKSSGTAPVMLWSHKADEPVGRWISLKEDTIGLLVRGRINLASSRGRDAHAHITGGDVTGLSIGYRVPKGGEVYDAKNGVNRLSAIDLFEISLVTIPSNRLARIRVESKGELEELLCKRANLSREAARRVVAGGYDALTNTQSPNLSPLVRALQASAKRY